MKGLTPGRGPAPVLDRRPSPDTSMSSKWTFQADSSGSMNRQEFTGRRHQGCLHIRRIFQPR